MTPDEFDGESPEPGALRYDEWVAREFMPRSHVLAEFEDECRVQRFLAAEAEAVRLAAWRRLYPKGNGAVIRAAVEESARIVAASPPPEDPA